MHRASHEAAAQRKALTRAFLARFFENEITRGTHDLRASFVTLGVSLAVPAALLPAFIGGWSWSAVGSIYGFDYLRDYTLSDKVLILGVGMVVTALIGALVWNSVLIDRRDALVLGALPIPAPTVVRAKLVALAVYVAVIGAAMHGPSSLMFGSVFSAGSASYAVVGALAHFTAAFLASAFVMLAIAGAQAVLLLAAGPPRFRRWSAWLQLALVSAAVLLLLWLPAIGDATRETYRHQWQSSSVRPESPGTSGEAWIRWMPPVWFLGIYETLLPPIRLRTVSLGATAAAGLGAVALLTFVGLPLAYRRVMVSGVEEPEGFGRTGALARVAEVWASVISRRPASRASLQFFFAAAGRVDRQRFVLAVALGAALAWMLPTLMRWLTLARDPPAAPEPGLMQLPYAVMLCVLVGLRVAAALPAHLPAGWMLMLAEVPNRIHRAALRRTMFAFGVLPAIAVLLPVYWGLWGRSLALTHATLVVAVGALLVNLLLWQFSGMPCGSAWAPLRTRFRLFWPVYLLAIGVYTQLWRFSVALATEPVRLAVVLAVLAAIAIGVGIAGARAGPVPRYDSDQESASLQVLNLD